MSHSSTKFLRYDFEDINEPSILACQKEINETPENRAACLEILRRELKNLKDIEVCMDEDFLLRFLRVAKFDTEKTMQRVLNYYKKGDALIEIYKKIPISLQKVDTMRHIWVSPYRCQNNSFLVIGKCAIDFRKFTFAERFFLEVLFVHKMIKNPVNQICGGTYILDYQGFDIHGLIAYTPGWVKTFLDFLLKVFPCRMKALHIVNAPSIFYPIWKVGYHLLSKKIQTRFFLHTKNEDWTNLHASISPDILPEEYGGKLKQNELINCLENLKEMEETFYQVIEFGYIKTKKHRDSLKVFY